MKAAEFVESLEQPERARCEAAGQEAQCVETKEPSCCDVDESVCFEPVEPIELAGLIELILKDRGRLHKMIRDPSLQPKLIPRFLAISLIGFVFFGVAMSLVLDSAGSWPKLTAIEDRLSDAQLSLIEFPAAEALDAGNARRPATETGNAWLNGAAFKLVGAYSFGLIAATGICLPSLYFFCLLSGVRMSMLDVVIHALKAKATAAVALVGILPIYAALSLGIVIFSAPPAILHATLWAGLILPFIAGFWGTRSLYVGFAGLCDTMPPEQRVNRECFLRRLVLSWSACYSTIVPVMIFTIWQSLGT